MTTEEFSNELDVLLNSFSKDPNLGDSYDKASIVLDEYEKSVVLTKAQEEIVIELYSGKNSFLDSFEKTEEVRRYLIRLVKTYKVSDREDGYTGLSDNSVFFRLPEDLWFITYESAILKDSKLGCLCGINALVVPITQDEYYKAASNPFRNSNERRVLRLDFNENTVELISKYNIDTYLIKYLSRPKPIILSDLPDNLSINGETSKSECELNPVIHRAILERAVKLAIMSKVPYTGK